MFQGYAFKSWTEREFPILKELTDISVLQHQQYDLAVPTEQVDVSHVQDAVPWVPFHARKLNPSPKSQTRRL